MPRRAYLGDPQVEYPNHNGTTQDHTRTLSYILSSPMHPGFVDGFNKTRVFTRFGKRNAFRQAAVRLTQVILVGIVEHPNWFARLFCDEFLSLWCRHPNVCHSQRM